MMEKLFEDPLLFVPLMTFITTIAGFAYTWFTNARNRDWAIQDKDQKHLELTNTIAANVADLNSKLLQLQQRLDKLNHVE